MTLFLPRRRATALIESGPPTDPERHHLFILMTDPVGDEQEILIVPVCKINRDVYYDNSCELSRDDHDFLHKPSYVAYRHARITTAQKLVNGVNDGVIIPRGTITEEVFGRICDGFGRSPHVRAKIRAFIEGMRG